MREGWERHPLGAGFAPRDIADSPTPDYDQGVGFRKRVFGGTPKWYFSTNTVVFKKNCEIEFVKRFKALFLPYGKEKYRQSCLSSDKSP